MGDWEVEAEVGEAQPFLARITVVEDRVKSVRFLCNEIVTSRVKKLNGKFGIMKRISTPSKFPGVDLGCESR